MRHLILSLGLAAALAACGGGGGGGDSPDASTASGHWIAGPMAVGDALEFDLTSQASAVHGTGSHAELGGHGGTLSASGTWQAPDLSLTLTYDDGTVRHLQGTLTSGTMMVATVSNADGTMSTQQFNRR